MSFVWFFVSCIRCKLSVLATQISYASSVYSVKPNSPAMKGPLSAQTNGTCFPSEDHDGIAAILGGLIGSDPQAAKNTITKVILNLNSGTFLSGLFVKILRTIFIVIVVAIGPTCQ